MAIEIQYRGENSNRLNSPRYCTASILLARCPRYSALYTDVMRFVLLLLLFPALLFSDEPVAKVLKVHDADTIVVLQNSHILTVRLKGIDCPETGEASGPKAKQYASDVIQGKIVKLKTYGKDKLGRTIADVFLENGKLFNQELVLTGYCRWGRSRAMRP
jgi:micrococcal nuclease